jgi:hypothetical protein
LGIRAALAGLTDDGSLYHLLDVNCVSNDDTDSSATGYVLNGIDDGYRAECHRVGSGGGGDGNRNRSHDCKQKTLNEAAILHA